MRIKPKHLELLGSHTLADGATCLAAAPTAAAGDARRSLVAAGGYDSAIVLFDASAAAVAAAAQSGSGGDDSGGIGGLAVVAELAGHEGGTTSLAFASPTLLVSAGEDGTAAVWDCGEAPGAAALKARLACEGVDVDK